MAVYDVIVVGLGGMGSAAAAHVARRGKRVLGLDRFPPAHDQGSSHGRSRIIREAYWEHPSYVPLVRRAYELWEEVERASATLLLLTTGGLWIGPPDGPLIRGALESARLHQVAQEVLNAAEIRKRFPVFTPATGEAGVLEPRAGVLFPEESVLAHLRQAARAGADLHHGEAVTEWIAAPRGVEVMTSQTRYEAGALIITAGPWAPQVLADLDLPLTVERQVVGWFRPSAPAAAFDPERCPVFVWHYGGRFFYGFPLLGFEGVKIAEHKTGRPTTADEIRRDILPEEITELRRDFMARCLPAANGPLVASSTCMYTMTPDTHFAIGLHPLHDNVAVAAGFSGHGFKFAPVVGEILADLALDGRTDHDISLFALDRFARA